MAAVAKVTISCTELPQFSRLVEFVDDCRLLADEQDNEGLQALLRDLRNDLLDKHQT